MNIFEKVNTFMIRTPILPFNKYLEFFSDNLSQNELETFILDICNDNLFRESILVSSKNLYNSMNSFQKGKKIKKPEYFYQSLIKYFIRMSTRSTPFGLFSGINFGRYSITETKMNIDKNNFKKHIRPDIEWIISLVKEFEQKYYNKLYFTLNDNLYLKGDRAFLLHSTSKNDNSDIGEVSIRITKPLKIIMNEYVNIYFSFDQLKDRLLRDYQNIDHDRITNYLKDLIKNEYLISNLRPPLTVKDQFEYLINELKSIKFDVTFINELINIKKNMDTYSNIEIGEGENYYLNLYNRMQNVLKTKNVIQIDLKSNYINSKINDKKLMLDINRFLKMCLKISTPYLEIDTYFSRYKNEYIEKYGYDREIPLLEMLDNDKGIGAPLNYEKPRNTKIESLPNLNDNINPKVKDYLINKYTYAVRNNESIKIYDKEIKNLELDEINYLNIPNSLEINLIVKANTENDIKNSNFTYYLGPNLGSVSAGKSFGRFSYMMSDEIKLFDILDKKIDKLNYNEYKSCEISYLPNTLRNANVSRNVHSSELEISLFTNSSKKSSSKINLNDLLIGIENNLFYVKSKSLNKKLNITITNMLNTELAPNAIRFLHDLSLDGKNRWYFFPWIKLYSQLSYIPKIEYKNFVISQETWILSYSIAKTMSKISFKMFKKLFNDYCVENKLPKYIYIAIEDNRILLNVDNDQCLKILQHEINNCVDSIILQAFENSNFNLISDENKNQYISELIIPLVKVAPQNKFLDNKKSNKQLTRKNLLNIRLKVPFDNWLYLKLYGIGSNTDNFIAFYISDYCQKLIFNKSINKYFFMRYADPKQHIRLRLNAPTNQLLSIYTDIKKWLEELINSGLLSYFTIDSYERELERYGGVELTKVAETLFFYDSMVVENILKYKKLSKIKYRNELIGIVSIINYMKEFGLSHKEQVTFLRSQVNISDFRKDFKNNRKRYLNLCNTDNNWENLSNEIDGNILLNVYSPLNNIINEYSSLIKTNLETSTDLSILNSIIHMHCNRLFGIDLEFERKIRALTSHALYALEHIKINHTI